MKNSLNQFRPATHEEILERLRYEIRNGRPVRYRHPVREVLSGNAKKGAAHKRYTRGKVTVAGGIAYVRVQGSMVPLEATAAFNPVSGNSVVFDLRLEGTK